MSSRQKKQKPSQEGEWGGLSGSVHERGRGRKGEKIGRSLGGEALGKGVDGLEV